MARFTWIKGIPFDEWDGTEYSTDELKNMNGVYDSYDDAMASAKEHGEGNVFVVMLRENK